MFDVAAPYGPLSWGIKSSLISYVRDMSDGSVQASGGASAADPGFTFAAASESAPEPAPAPGTARELRFVGTVTLTGHGGLLRLEVGDPWLVPGTGPEDPWQLTIRDPFAPGDRVVFASVARVAPDAHGTLRGSGTVLTDAGSELFFAGPYVPGTELDDPAILGARA